MKLFFSVSLVILSIVSMSFAQACDSLTSAQMCTIRTDMDTHPELTTAILNEDLVTIVSFYNADTSPAVEAWRVSVNHDTITESVDWAEYVAISRQKQGAFSMLTRERILQTGLANVRAGLIEIFTSAESPNTRAALIAVAKRTMTVCENVFKLGSGPTYDLGVDGPIDNSTVLWALTNCQ